MKKTGIFILIFVSVLFITPVISFATVRDELSNAEDSVGYSSFLDAIPEKVLAFSEDLGIDLSSESLLPEFSAFFRVIFSLFFDGIVAVFPLVSVGMILIMVFKLLLVLDPGKSGLVEVLGFLAALSSGIYSFSVLEKMLESLTAAAEQVSSFFTAALPVITASQVLAGESEGALAVAASFPVILFILSTLISTVFYPLCWFCYAAALLGFPGSTVSIRPVIGGIKRFCSRGVEVVSGLAVGVFCIQRVAAGTADSVARKSAKFALARLIPVAGGTLSDGLETVYACGQSVRGKIGLVCVIVLLGLFVAPCVFGLIYVLLYSLLSSVGSSFGVPVLADFFSDVKDTFSMMSCFSICSLVVLSSGILIFLGG